MRFFFFLSDARVSPVREFSKNLKRLIILTVCYRIPMRKPRKLLQLGFRYDTVVTKMVAKQKNMADPSLTGLVKLHWGDKILAQ